MRASRIIIAALAFLAGVGLVGYELLEAPTVQVFGPTLAAVPQAHDTVALTFDDGPNPPYTDAILRVLERHDVHATFFVVGRAVGSAPQTLRRMVADGDAIGNHTWDHAHLNMLSQAGVRDEIERTDAAVFAATGRHTTLLRPPFGARDFAVIAQARQLGYTVVMWSVPLPHDWEQPGAGVIADRVLSRVTSGSIIVLHDGDRGLTCPAQAAPCERGQEAQATDRIVTALQARGFRFVTVPQLLALQRENARTVARRE